MNLLLPLIILTALTATPMPAPAGTHTPAAHQRLIQNCGSHDRCDWAARSRSRRAH